MMQERRRSIEARAREKMGAQEHDKHHGQDFSDHAASEVEELLDESAKEKRESFTCVLVELSVADQSHCPSCMRSFCELYQLHLHELSALVELISFIRTDVHALL